jgi:hypothetical protein
MKSPLQKLTTRVRRSDTPEQKRCHPSQPEDNCTAGVGAGFRSVMVPPRIDPDRQGAKEEDQSNGREPGSSRHPDLIGGEAVAPAQLQRSGTPTLRRLSSWPRLVLRAGELSRLLPLRLPVGPPARLGRQTDAGVSGESRPDGAACCVARPAHSALSLQPA